MELNEIIRAQILTLVENQLRIDQPKETRQAFERLKKLGYSDEDSKKLIAQCIAVEIYNAFKYKKPYNEAKYIKNLKKLPEEPFD